MYMQGQEGFLLISCAYSALSIFVGLMITYPENYEIYTFLAGSDIYRINRITLKSHQLFGYFVILSR